MFKYYFIISALSASAYASNYDGSSDVICRDIDSGCICGTVRDAENGVQYFSFRGIPYAKQPLGELRFQELQPVDPWDDQMQTIEEGPICPQYDEVYGRLANPQQGMSEACIYANVHVPIVDTDDALPILVFIHGGSYQAGSGNTDLHGPEFLVSNNVIVITFNYRINVFGYMSMNNARFPGNNALRDIRTLLNWVQTNACAFGGDPNNVTLMGHSAGAVAAHLLSLSNATKGLFNRVILMSGTAYDAFETTIATDLFLATLGINSTDPDYIHEQLINMPLDDIMEANRFTQTKMGTVSFRPVVEGEYEGFTRIVDDNPLTLMEKGRGNELPMIIGFTSKEAEFFKQKLGNFVIAVTENPKLLLRAGISKTLNSTFSQQLGELIKKRYFSDTPTVNEFIKVASDTFFIYPAFKVTQKRTKQNGAPVYLYQFSYDSSYNVVKDGLMLNYHGGGAHGEDLTNVFRINSMLPSDQKTFPPISRDQMMKYWMTQFVVNFMKCDHPICHKPAMWPAVNATLMKYQSLYDPVFIGTNLQPTRQQLEMIEFFDSIAMKGNTSD